VDGLEHQSDLAQLDSRYVAEDVAVEMDHGAVEEVGRDEAYALFRRSRYMANIFEPQCVLSVSAEGLSGMLAKINT